VYEPEPYSLEAKRRRGAKSIGAFYRLKPRGQMILGLSLALLAIIAAAGAISSSSALEDYTRLVVAAAALTWLGMAIYCIHASSSRTKWRRKRGIPLDADWP
jgi:hypothetical protein